MQICVRTCINIVQKLRFIANDSFNPSVVFAGRRRISRPGYKWVCRVLFVANGILTIVCVLLPGSGAKTSPEVQIDATQAVTLASAAMSDARGLRAPA